MANEIQCAAPSGKTVYVVIRNSVGQVWNNTLSLFQTYSTPSYTQYALTMTEQGVASGFYTASVPGSITTPGVLSLVVKQQMGINPGETDPVLATGDLEWSGSATNFLGELATSGQVAGLRTPMLMGQAIPNFPFKLVSAADHVTPFTSGVVSGMIKRDGGAFGPLQSGAYTENGNGWYTLLALTSGDLNARTVALSFRAVNISGQGVSDPRDFTFVLTRSGGG